MTLFDELMSADPELADKKRRGVYHSKRLAEIVGREDPVPVVIEEVSPERVKRALKQMQNKDGSQDIERSLESELLLIVEGVKEPDLRDKNLMEHYGTRIPKQLARKLFGREVSDLAGEIMALSGYGDESFDPIEEDIEVIKN